MRRRHDPDYRCRRRAPRAARRPSCPVYLQFQEVCRAGNARVMVANTLLAPGLQRLLIETQPGRCDLPQIFFDDILVLRGRRNERGIENRPVGIETIAVIKNPARRLGTGVSDTGTWLGQDERPRWWLVVSD